ncbi:hypothetical protein IJG72_07585 [bacterium]|nr:hypothetical protein [bacterium]
MAKIEVCINGAEKCSFGNDLINDESKFKDNHSLNSIFQSGIDETQKTNENYWSFKNSSKVNSYLDLKAYLKDGHNARETYNYLVDNLKTNRNNPGYVQSSVDSILSAFSTMYDYNKPHKPVADTKEEALEKFLNSTYSKPVEAAICSTIHGLVKDALNDAGIPAVIVSSKAYGGENKERYGGHATLLYQISKNQYISNDYGTSTIVEANNIRDAVRQIYKESGRLSGEKGYFSISGKDGETYSEYLFQNESVYGNDIEKSSHIRENAFMGKNVRKNNSFEINADYAGKTNTRNAEAQVSIALPKKNTSIDIGVARKQSDETSTMLESKSYGAKVSIAHNKKLNRKGTKKLKLNSDLRLANISGKTKNNDYDTLILKGGINAGFEDNVINNRNFGMSLAAKASLVGSGHPDLIAGHGDFRASAEFGASFDKILNKKMKLHTELSAGVVGDFNKLNYTYQDIGVTPGFKSNIDLALTLAPSKKIMTEMYAQGYYLRTNSTEHYGLSGGIQGLYKVSDNVQLYGGFNINKNNKDIDVGLFEESIDKNLFYNIFLGTQIKKNLDFGINFTQDIKSKESSAGVYLRKTF